MKKTTLSLLGIISLSTLVLGTTALAEDETASTETQGVISFGKIDPDTDVDGPQGGSEYPGDGQNTTQPPIHGMTLSVPKKLVFRGVGDAEFNKITDGTNKPYFGEKHTQPAASFDSKTRKNLYVPNGIYYAMDEVMLRDGNEYYIPPSIKVKTDPSLIASGINPSVEITVTRDTFVKHSNSEMGEGKKYQHDDRVKLGINNITIDDFHKVKNLTEDEKQDGDIDLTKEPTFDNAFSSLNFGDGSDVTTKYYELYDFEKVNAGEFKTIDNVTKDSNGKVLTIKANIDKNNNSDTGYIYFGKDREVITTVNQRQTHGLYLRFAPGLANSLRGEDVSLTTNLTWTLKPQLITGVSEKF